MSRSRITGKRRLGLFDAFVLVGAAANVIVVLALVGYWLAN